LIQFSPKARLQLKAQMVLRLCFVSMLKQKQFFI
jgi:hypothetical protein